MSLARRALFLSLVFVLCHGLQAKEPQPPTEETPKPGPQPLLQTLPEDGAWVTYFVLLKTDGNEQQLEWTAASVGTKQVDGEPHRWLELSAKSGGSVYRVYKALIPESRFVPGKNPIRDSKELWVRYGNESPRRIPSIRDEDPTLDLLLSGPVSNVKKLHETEDVDWQKGRLKCEIWEGENKLDAKFFKLENKQRLLKNKSVPFGIAGSKVKISNGDRSAEVEYVLDNFGTGAKSLLPEIK
jgi:hypothetical protein